MHQLINIEAGDRLETTRQLVQYLTSGIIDCDEERFFIACMNPKRRPICRMHVRTGLLVASRISLADICLPLLVAEAKTFACLRTQPNGSAQPSLADGRLLWNLREAGRLIGVQLVDYLITKIETGETLVARARPSAELIRNPQARNLAVPRFKFGIQPGRSATNAVVD